MPTEPTIRLAERMTQLPPYPFGMIDKMKMERRWNGEDVIDLAKQYGFTVVNDFAHARVTFDGYRAPSYLEVPGAMDVGVEFGSFSK